MNTPETQFAPRAENYLPEPKFRYAPSRREIDFAQIVASGGDMIEALSLASIITEDERKAASRSQLYAKGTRLLSTPAVQERIDYYLLLHKASMDVSLERIQQELAAVSFADFAQLFHKEDSDELVPSFFDTDKLVPKFKAGDPIRNPHELPRHLRAAIKEWRFDKDGCLVAKFHDKLKSVNMLAELQGYMAEANRAKAPQINIAIGDGQGAPQARRVEGEVIEAKPVDNNIPDCLS